jgi:SAM-dependent methyltransferase
MINEMKIRFLKTELGQRVWKRWHISRGCVIGNYDRIGEYIRQYAPGSSFVDIGCMWGVNGAHSFLAEEVGATIVKGVDVFGPTPEFEVTKRERNSKVEFILGDVCDPRTIERIGKVDVVFCAGVLYHHPSPFDVLVALRRMSDRWLILRTASIPEIWGQPNAAVYYPFLAERERNLWNLGIGTQVGITSEFEPAQGYGNWFWGMTPSCIRSLLETSGFRVVHQAMEPFAQTFICETVMEPFFHCLPGEVEAFVMAKQISEAGIAHPA